MFRGLARGIPKIQVRNKDDSFTHPGFYMLFMYISTLYWVKLPFTSQKEKTERKDEESYLYLIYGSITNKLRHPRRRGLNLIEGCVW